jgi:hypothetical protein
MQLKDYFTGRSTSIESNIPDLDEIKELTGDSETRKLLIAAVAITAIGFIAAVFF